MKRTITKDACRRCVGHIDRQSRGIARVLEDMVTQIAAVRGEA